jgi:hypothetical protein
VRDVVTVVRPPEVEWKGPREVRVHRTDLRPTDVEVMADVPVTHALRTAWDVAALEPLGTAVAALDAMVRAGSIRLHQLTALAQQGTGRWGVTKVRRAVPLVDARAMSAPESRVSAPRCWPPEAPAPAPAPALMAILADAGQEVRAALTTALASSCTWARWSGPRKDSA